MDISWDLYRTFYMVAINGSISGAADCFYISQPAITFQIKKLEEQLGVSLFHRTKYGVNLTDEGKLLFDYVKVAMENITNGENALSNLKNLESGVIRIGVSTTLCRYILMPYIERFHELYPNIDIYIDNNLSNNLLKEVRNGNLDLAIMFTPKLENKDLKVVSFKEVQDIFVGNKKYYELTKEKKINLKDLEKYPLIFPKIRSSSRDYLNYYLKENSIFLKPKLEVASYNLIVDLISSGFGIGFVTKEFIMQELDNRSLYEIQVNPKVSKRTVSVVTPLMREPNYCAKKLIDMILKSK